MLESGNHFTYCCPHAFNVLATCTRYDDVSSNGSHRSLVKCYDYIYAKDADFGGSFAFCVLTFQQMTMAAV